MRTRAPLFWLSVLLASVILASVLLAFLTASPEAAGEESSGQIPAAPGQPVDDTLLLESGSGGISLLVPGDIIDWTLQMEPEGGSNKIDRTLSIESASKWRLDIEDAGPTEDHRWHLRTEDGSAALHYRMNITNLNDPSHYLPWDSDNPFTIAEGDPTSGPVPVTVELLQSPSLADDEEALYQIVLRFTASEII